LVVELPGIDQDADGDVADEDGDDEAAGRRKNVNGIQVEVIDVSHDIGSQTCCEINSRTLRRRLDANAKVFYLA